MTNIFLDIILLILAAIMILKCWKDGFAVSVLRFARVFIVLVGACILTWVLNLGILGFLVCLIALFVGVTVLMKILGLVTKIPVIHGIDKTLGLLLGVFCAILSLGIIAGVFRAVAYVCDSVSGSNGGFEFYRSSVVLSTIEKIFVKLRLLR